jgi:multicomponent K+:H+ antiporter subunit A
VTWLLLTRDHESISWYFLEQSVPKGGGSNVVNVILVDFRGYDTFGEITVLGIAAIGVLALMDGMRTRRPAWPTRGPSLDVCPPAAAAARGGVGGAAGGAGVHGLHLHARAQPAGRRFHCRPDHRGGAGAAVHGHGAGPGRGAHAGRCGRRFVRWIGSGLGIAGLTGVGAFVLGRPFLTSAFGHPHVPLLGELPLATAALFDLGVYLTVVGSTLLTISVLGTVSREAPTPPRPGASHDHAWNSCWPAALAWSPPPAST